ncbi:MAG: uroporphyrinogen-III C-methyltransferase [Motiliproteus sp.]|nr:uroporphyrinogen-III C-methyltransferase [Motiliproteus sp.]MCW9051355.1 uroporphyrinogen-III C-methyltransferase [Motiliproteus sp.]
MEKSMNDKELEQENLQTNEENVSDTTEAVDTEEVNSDQAELETDASEAVDGDTESTTEETQGDQPSSDEVVPDDVTEPVAAQQTEQPAQEAKKSRSWIGVLAFFLAICALIVAGYGFQKIQELQAQAATLQSTTAGLNKDLESNLQQSLAEAAKAGKQASSAGAQLQTLQSEISAQANNVNELQDRLTRSMKQISQVGTDKRKDWLLAEVEYLLRLANQRALMEKSPVGALALLQSSDRILKETDDVSIYNVRKAIASDIAALESVPKLDIDGIFLKLAALNEQVANLKLIPISEKREFPAMLEKVTPEGVTETWNQGLKTSWNQAMDKLEKLVVIQHRDKPIEPLLSPEQVYFLQQNLHLMIEQAQLSLLQGHQGSYDASLKKAGEWVGKYFKADDGTTQALQKGLNDLKSVQVSPALPDISGSLNALKAYFTDVHSGKGAA